MNRIELFKFERGDDAWYFTNAEIDITYDGNEYLSETLGRSDIEESTELSKSTLDVTMSLGNDLSQDIINQYVERFLYLTLYVQQDDETDIAWRGRHTSTNPSGRTMVLAFESNFTALGKYGLTRRYQMTCPHSLYSTNCGADREDFTESIGVSDVSGSTVTFADSPVNSDSYYKYGMILEPSGLYGYIIEKDDATITMQRNLDSLTTAFNESGYGNSYGKYYGKLAVSIYAGCMKDISTCESKFNNNLNFGGYPYMPDVDITSSKFI